MRSQVEGNTRRIWIRNEITSKNAHDCIYSVAIMQSSDSHCIIVFVFCRVCNTTSLSSATKTLEASKI